MSKKPQDECLGKRALKLFKKHFPYLVVDIS